MIRLSFIIAYFVILVSTQMPSTTDWRGLSPLKSTRMDVERLLGSPDQKIENEQVTYYLPDVVVVFYFEGNPKCRQKLTRTSWDVPTDTVTAIDVTLKHPPLVSESSIDLKKLEKTKGDYDVNGHFYYWNSEHDFAVEVGNNYLAGYLYRPGSMQRNLQCSPNRDAR
jgi:hypothetical protein